MPLFHRLTRHFTDHFNCLGSWLLTTLRFRALPRPFIIVTLSLTLLGSGLSAFAFVSIAELKGIKSLEQYRPSVITRVYDTKGRLINEFYKERRELTTYRNIHPNVIKSILATEDKRFFSHFGIDPWRIGKALLVNLAAMKKEQGGSTLTIQLSKLLFLDHQKTVKRKLKELWYSIQIEKQYSKQEILSFYLNELNYGHGSYGIQAATKFFFTKTPRTVSLGEAALLAGIPKSPRYYSPIRYRENAMRRHRIVLTAMVQNAYITTNEAYDAYQSFWNQFLQTLRARKANFGRQSDVEAPYFTEYIREKLERELGNSELYQKGIHVYTTLNLDHQRSAQRHLKTALAVQNKVYARETKTLPEALPKDISIKLSTIGETFGIPALSLSTLLTSSLRKTVIEERLKYELRNIAAVTGITSLRDYAELNYQTNSTLPVTEHNAEGAFISIEPSSGYITALIGGTRFNYYNQFNRAILLRRQIGSTIKPFIYAVAMEQGIITAATVLHDVPTIYNEYIPKNYSGRHYGNVLVRDALKRSINVLAIDVLHRTGITPMREQLAEIFLAVSAGSRKEMFPNDLTLALGSGSFSPLTLATAYAVLANEGKKVLPRTIRYITDNNGTMIKNYETDYLNEASTQLISRETAFIIANIIRGVFTPGGTAFIPQLVAEFNHARKSFGKTGTTSNWTDAWFAGANKTLAAVVWLGYDDNRSLGRNRTGGIVAAPVWLRFQRDVLNDADVTELSPPQGVIKQKICKQLGTLAGPYTPARDTYEEYFTIETTPTDICNYSRQKLEASSSFTTFNNPANKAASQLLLQELKAAASGD